MTPNEERVLALSSQLEDLSFYADENKCKLIDGEWNAHHANDLLVSCSCEEYQVIRNYDVEIEPYDPADDITDEEEYKLYEEDSDAFYEQYMADNDLEDPFYQFEVGEYMQRWINLKSGEVIVLGKVYEQDPSYCDLEGKWEIVSGEDVRDAAKKFYNRFKNHWGEGHYIDHNVNSILKAHGYNGISTADWYICTGSEMEENRTPLAKFFVANDWYKFLMSVAKGDNGVGGLFCKLGEDLISFAYNRKEDEIEHALAALKIMVRNHYQPTDMERWKRMINNLIYLKKDTHNAHYVCPTDFDAAYDKYMRMVMNKEERIMRERRRVEEERARIEMQRYMDIINAESKESKNYQKHINQFYNLEISGGEFDIQPLHSVREFFDEGTAMHHCVFRMGYYKKFSSLILSVKDKQGERVATIELDLNTMEIKQCYAEHDKIPQQDKEIRQLVSDNIQTIKDLYRKAV